MRAWWRRRSVRTRLTVAASAVMAVALGLAAVSLVWGLHRSLLGSVDSTAKERAQDAARLPATDGVLPTSAEADNVVQIIDATGQVVASTSNVVGEPRLFAFAPRGVEVRSVRQVRVPDAADSYRVAVVPVAGGRLVYAAVPDDDAREAVRRLVVALAIGFPVLVGVLSLVTWLLVGRALRPVEAANRRQREFVADAAHELRSPLASLRTELEVAAAGSSLLASVDRVSNVTDDLLQLARLDDANVPMRRLDMDDIVFAEVARIRARSAVAIDVTQVSAAQVDGDAGTLTRLARNLLDNAVRHAATTVRVSLTMTEGVMVFTVADDGPGVPAADKERIFERFTRLDDARTRSVGGAGLGLAIVRTVAEKHGGTATVADEAGAVFVVRLPAARADAANPRPVVRPDVRPAR